MEIFGAVLTVVVGLFTGLCIGLIGGFGIAANTDIASGVARAFTNPVLRWISRPANNLSFLDCLAYLVLLPSWLLVFCILIGAPFLVGAKFSVADPVLPWVGGIPLLVGIFLGKFLGSKLWIRVSASDA